MSDNNLREFFEKEIKSMKKSTTRQLVIGCLLIIVLVVYFVILNSNLNKHFKPEPLADFLYNETSAMLPRLEKELNSSLKTAIPPIVGEIIREFKKTIPELRRYFERQLVDISDEAVDTGIAKLDGMYAQLIKSSKAKLIEADKNGFPIDVNIFYDELEASFKEMLKEEAVKGGDGETVLDKLEMSHKKLLELNAKLKLLTGKSKGKLSQRDHMEKKFIQTWIIMMNKLNKSVDSEDGDSVTIQQKHKPIKKAPEKKAPVKKAPVKKAPIKK